MQKKKKKKKIQGLWCFQENGPYGKSWFSKNLSEGSDFLSWQIMKIPCALCIQSLSV